MVFFYHAVERTNVSNQYVHEIKQSITTSQHDKSLLIFPIDFWSKSHGFFWWGKDKTLQKLLLHLSFHILL